ncbi:MAG TPA: glycosyltransferase [bacterium]|nr:glycosyltransferase [bacterium]
MRLLMITPNFPPEENPEAVVNYKLALALSQAGVEMTVLTRELDRGEKIDESWPAELDAGEVVRIARPWHMLPARVVNNLTRARMRQVAMTWFGGRAYDAARRLLRRGRFDAVLSRSGTVDAIAAVSHLQQEFKPRWIAGINDPLPPCLYPAPYHGSGRNLRERLELKWLRKALSRADQVMFPCEALGRHLARGLDLDFHGRMLVVPHIGWSAAPEKTNHLEILHAGSVGGPRISEPFFAALAQALREFPSLARALRVTFLGKVNDDLGRVIARYGLSDNVRVEPHLGYGPSLRRMAQSHLLLLMEATLQEGIFFPSKFADYSAAQKPLLLFCPERGTISDFVGGYEHPGFLGQSEEKCRERLARLFHLLERGDSIAAYAYPRPGDFDPARVARELIARL